MPRGVYSTHFFHGQFANAAQAAALAYTVPVGKVAVVRSIDVMAITPGNCFVIRKSTPFSYVQSIVGLGIFATRHWDGHLVLSAGEVIGCQHSDGAASVDVSGYLLNVVP